MTGKKSQKRRVRIATLTKGVMRIANCRKIGTDKLTHESDTECWAFFLGGGKILIARDFQNNFSNDAVFTFSSNSFCSVGAVQRENDSYIG